MTEPDPVAGAAGAGPSTTYAYDVAGNTVSMTDPLGRTTFYAYDRNDRLVVTADATSGVTSATWSGDTLNLSSSLGNERFSDSTGVVVRISGSLPGVSNADSTASATASRPSMLSGTRPSTSMTP